MTLRPYNQPFVYVDSPSERYVRRSDLMWNVKLILLESRFRPYTATILHAIHSCTFMSEATKLLLYPAINHFYPLFRFNHLLVKDVFVHDAAEYR